MTKEEILSELEKLEPFYHGIDLPYGIRTGEQGGEGGTTAKWDCKKE